MAIEEGKSPISSHLQSDPSESSNNSEKDEVSEDFETMNEMFPSNSYDHVSCDESSPDQSNFCFDMGDEKTEIDFNPDYILYNEIYSTISKITFNEKSIQIQASTFYENKESFSAEFSINDVIKIQPFWCQGLQTAEVKIYVKTSESENNLLKFTVFDSYWNEKSEAIFSLNSTYEALWDDSLNNYEEINQEIKKQFPEFNENFGEVIYPKGDKDAVSISIRDIDLLKPDIFVNDTIIDFYIKYLKNKIVPEKVHKYHFFNCFFFRKLADMDKDPSSAFNGKAAFLRVRKWTRKVNLFDKDFIFIPVNYNYHWSLIVICHPGEIANIQNEDMNKVPCILHMDSLKGSHSNLKELMQSYLWEEYKERQKVTVEEEKISSKFLNLRFIPLELPQQQNLYDCGLFLLHYVELFLEDGPENFSPFMITHGSKFLNENWFLSSEPSLKRSFIHKLIHELLNKQSEVGPTNEARDSREVSFSKGEMGILRNGKEMDVLEGSSVMGFRDFFESNNNNNEEEEEEVMFIEGEYGNSFARNTCFDQFGPGLASIEEEEEMGGELCLIDPINEGKSNCELVGPTNEVNLEMSSREEVITPWCLVGEPYIPIYLPTTTITTNNNNGHHQIHMEEEEEDLLVGSTNGMSDDLLVGSASANVNGDSMEEEVIVGSVNGNDEVIVGSVEAEEEDVDSSPPTKKIKLTMSPPLEEEEEDEVIVGSANGSNNDMEQVDSQPAKKKIKLMSPLEEEGEEGNDLDFKV